MRRQSDPQPSPPPTAPPLPGLQQRSDQQQQQLSGVECSMCFTDIESNESVITCKMCHTICHRNEIFIWLVSRLDNGQPAACPQCRADMTWILDEQKLGLAPAHTFLSPSHNGNNNDSPAAAVPPPTFDFEIASQPHMYIIGVELSSLKLHQNTTEVIAYTTDNQSVNDIIELNPRNPFYIVSSEQASPNLISNPLLIHYYYVSEPVSHAETKLIIHDRVTNINSIERFSSELYTDLAQYYQDKAHEALSEEHDRAENKILLEKSKKCLDMLKDVTNGSVTNTDASHESS